MRKIIKVIKEAMMIKIRFMIRSNVLLMTLKDCLVLRLIDGKL